MLPDDDWSQWINALIVNLPADKHDSSEGNQVVDRARQLLAAIDRGGVPTDPILVNNIARALGLQVLTTAPMKETIARIRLMLNAG